MTRRLNEWKIIILDTNNDLCEVYRNDFENNGYDVMTFDSAAEAFQAISTSNEIKLIVLDINLNGVDGLALIEAIRDERPDIRIVVNTDLSHYQNDFRSWLADDFVVKSNDSTVLYGKVQELIDGV